MDWKDLAGTWKYARVEEPDGTGWIEMLVDGRIYTPVHDGAEMPRRYPCQLRGVIESPGLLRVFPKGNEVGWTVAFLLDGETLKLMKKDGSFYICTRAKTNEPPQWFYDDVAKVSASPPP